MSTLDTLVRPLTPAQVESALYAAMTARGLTVTSWLAGAVVRTVVTALAIVLSALTQVVALVAKSGFLELAEGPWLDLVAYHVYGTERIAETFATGEVTLTNDTGAGAFINVQPGDLVVRAASGPAAGKTYRNTEVFSLAASVGVSVTVAVQADEAGSASTTAAGSLTSFVTTFVGCSVTNSAALIGTDEEGDEALRARARAKTGVLSPNGPRDAYSYVATSAVRADGTSIGITRVRAIPDGIGGVDVYVADADGVVSGTVGDLDTDLGIVDRDIQEQVVPLAITARVQTASANTIAVTYELWVDSAISMTTEEVEDAVEESIAAYLSTVPIGGERIAGDPDGKVFRSALAAAITRVVGSYLIRCELTLPATDVVIGESEAPLAGVVTATNVHQISSLGVI